MLRFLTTIAVILWIVVGVTELVALAPSPIDHYPIRCGEEQQCGHGSRERNASLVSVVFSDIGFFFHKNRDDINAGSTFVIACFTVILSIVGYTQAALTRSSVKIAERSLTELERPWIFLDGANVKRRESPGSPIIPNNWEVKLGWQNVGRSPALIKTCVFEVVARSILAARPDYTRCTYELACRASVPAAQGFLTNEIRLDPSALPTVDMVAYGRLTYVELNGTTHHSGFALEISQTEERFATIHNDAYTYYT